MTVIKYQAALGIQIAGDISWGHDLSENGN